jgi:HD-like signal output (HDOD) protein
MMDTRSPTDPLVQGPGPEQIAQAAPALPPAARIIPRLLDLLADPNTDIPEITEVIRLEQGLASRVLRMSYSPVFSRGARASSVDEAVARVGFAQVHRLVADAIAHETLASELPAYGISGGDLWHHSLLCAVAAERLAGISGNDFRIGYTLGLLQGVGLVAVDAWARRHHPAVRFRHQRFPDDWSHEERTLLGCTHADVGSALLKLWGFPPAAFEPVRAQYHPDLAGAHAGMAAVLEVSRWFRDAASEDVLPPPPGTLTLQRLRITEAGRHPSGHRRSRRRNRIGGLIGGRTSGPNGPSRIGPICSPYAHWAGSEKRILCHHAAIVFLPPQTSERRPHPR